MIRPNREQFTTLVIIAIAYGALLVLMVVAWAWVPAHPVAPAPLYKHVSTQKK
jgi:hypothetical protein